MEHKKGSGLSIERIEKRGRFRLSAGVLPATGANLVSFRVDDRELLFWDARAFRERGRHTGAFNMFPTPCRLAGCAYSFEGRRIRQRKRGQDVFIHGLIRDEPLEFRNEGARIVSWLEITPEHPAYEGFPFRCRVSIAHELDDAGLTVRFEVRNRDSRNLPFGYGIHPYWRLNGPRRGMRVRIPCENVLESKDLVPTGGYSPAASAGVDLRQMRSMERFHSDHVFWPRRPGDTAEIEWPALKLGLTISASEAFRHMIVYAPPRRRFVCVENLTCSPNAPNLLSAGHGEVANLRVVPPGGVARAWVRYEPSRL